MNQPNHPPPCEDCTTPTGCTFFRCKKDGHKVWTAPAKPKEN